MYSWWILPCLNKELFFSCSILSKMLRRNFTQSNNIITHLCTAFSTFNVVLAHVNFFQDICYRNQAGFCFFWPQKSAKTTNKQTNRTNLSYWSVSMSEARERAKTWMKHYLGKFIHISYYFFQHLLFNDCIFYCRFFNIYKHEESDRLSFHPLLSFYQ